MFSKFTKILSRKHPRFQSKKQQVQNLRTKATQKYGIIFEKQLPSPDIKMEIEDFKDRDRQIFEKFTQTIKHSRAVSQ